MQRNCDHYLRRIPGEVNQICPSNAIAFRGGQSIPQTCQGLRGSHRSRNRVAVDGLDAVFRLPHHGPMNK